jgi:hypothetical protein
MLSKTFIFFGMILFILSSCVQHKVTQTQRYIGHKTGESLLIPLPESPSARKSERMAEYAHQNFRQKAPFLRLAEESEAYYLLKQHGLPMPTYHTVDSATLLHLHRILGVDYLLVSTTRELRTFPDYELGEPQASYRATLLFRVYHLPSQALLWEGTTSTTANGLRTRNHLHNPYSVEATRSKAWKKSMKTLAQAFALNANP